MQVCYKDLFTPEDIWTDHEDLPKLQQTIKDILAVCSNQDIVLDADKALIEPIMQKWENKLQNVDLNESQMSEDAFDQ